MAPLLETCLEKGRYRARMARGSAGLSAAQDLRGRAFGLQGPDADDFDALCGHVLIEERDGGALAGCCRVLPLENGAAAAGSYSAQFYGLEGLGSIEAPVIELGRFCTAPGAADPDILRLAWGYLALVAERLGAGLLFGCSSFPGTEPERHRGALAELAARHLAPRRWRPGVKARDVVQLPRAGEGHDRLRALKAMPPLLRGYLSMGGRVSDHAVVDRQMNTLHVFTGLEVAAVPAGRRQLLRAVAG